MISANDTDVLVIVVATFSQLQELGLQQLWLAFGQGRNLKWIPVHELTSTLAPERSSGILSHIYEVYWQPPCVVHIVVCIHVWDQLTQSPVVETRD